MKVNFLKKRLITAGTSFAAIILAGLAVGMSISLCLTVVRIAIVLWL